MAVGDAEEAERADQQVQVARLDAGTEDAGGHAAVEDFRHFGEDRLVQRADHLRLGQVRGVVDVLDADQADEVDVAVVVLEGELDHAAQCRLRVQLVELERRFGGADVAVELLQHGQVELLLAGEVVVDHPLGDVGALGDGIHPRAAQAVLGELGDGGEEDVLAGLLRVVLARLARLARLGGGLR
ncbi:hypothetical protein D3C78_1211980 [compost metagenome]